VSATVDVNILVYASDESSRFHERASSFLADVVAGPRLLYLFWPTMMGYLRLATHPAVFEHPLSPDEARTNVEALLTRPHVRTGSEDDGFWRTFALVTAGLPTRGNLVPDAHIVALMHQHGVHTIWSHDRDLRKFIGIEVKDPLD
jgi:toxin-antitoxin system PIN domain toxin